MKKLMIKYSYKLKGGKTFTPDDSELIRILTDNDYKIINDLYTNIYEKRGEYVHINLLTDALLKTAKENISLRPYLMDKIRYYNLLETLDLCKKQRANEIRLKTGKTGFDLDFEIQVDGIGGNIEYIAS